MLAVSIPSPISTMRSVGNGTPSSSAGTAFKISPRVVTPTNAHAHSRSPKSLNVVDKIYGEFLITEPVLIDLLESEAIQRLKLVLQHGITALIGVTPTPPITRYEHSVGAMLLVRQAGGTAEAQASALLHDVAHTALSHVVDGVFGYVVHEEDKMEYLDTTSVPEILTRHGFDPDQILEEVNFPLLELDAPAICADRLDYGIRDSNSFGFLTLEDARSVAKNLRASKDGRFCFASAKWAKTLSVAYMQSDEFAWSNPLHSALYSYAADTIREAHSSGLMLKSELWAGGDRTFWDNMVNSNCPRVKRLASKVDKQLKVKEITKAEAAELPASEQFYRERTKVRTLDPDVLQSDGQVKTLCELDEEYKHRREVYLKSKAGEKFYKIVPAGQH